jgi:hypothetical protein
VLASSLVVALSAASAPAWAQSSPATYQTAPAIPQPDAPRGGLNLALLGTGAFIFVPSYATAVVVAADSGSSTDRWLYAPVIGPWVAYAQKDNSCLECGQPKVGRNFLLVDGIFQAAGFGLALSSLFVRERPSSTLPYAKAGTQTARTDVRLSPGRVGGAGYGLMAVGTF